MPPNSPYPASTGRCLSTSTLSSTPAFASRASRSRARRRSIAGLTPASEAGASTRGFSSTCGRPRQASRRARALRRQDGPSDGQKGSCTDLRVGREDWTAARLEVLAEEKALMRQADALAAKRRAMPWTLIEKTYVFDAPEGR